MFICLISHFSIFGLQLNCTCLALLNWRELPKISGFKRMIRFPFNCGANGPWEIILYPPPTPQLRNKSLITAKQTHERRGIRRMHCFLEWVQALASHCTSVYDAKSAISGRQNVYGCGPLLFCGPPEQPGWRFLTPGCGKSPRQRGRIFVSQSMCQWPGWAILHQALRTLHR